MLVARIPAYMAQDAIEELLDRNLIDEKKKIQRSEEIILIPLKSDAIPESLKRKYQIKFEELDERLRGLREDPYELIKKELFKEGLSENLIDDLPAKWEMLGDVLILRLTSQLLPDERKIASAYAKILGARAVLNAEGSILGTERVPVMRTIFGTETETVHKENGVRYCFDAAKIMFSPGNIDERIRMAAIDCDDEIVLDMFAGIGYFSLPMAIHGNPRRIFSCEIRKFSFDYLVTNIELNEVEDMIVPILGDNRDVNLEDKVNRIIMGYLKETSLFLPKALSCLKSGGIIHYHENCPNELIYDRPIRNLERAAGRDWKSEIISSRIVKSFAPGVSHIVIDARFTSS